MPKKSNFNIVCLWEPKVIYRLRGTLSGFNDHQNKNAVNKNIKNKKRTNQEDSYLFSSNNEFHIQGAEYLINKNTTLNVLHFYFLLRWDENVWYTDGPDRVPT